MAGNTRSHTYGHAYDGTRSHTEELTGGGVPSAAILDTAGDAILDTAGNTITDTTG